jgi:hypothetical protein
LFWLGVIAGFSGFWIGEFSKVLIFGRLKKNSSEPIMENRSFQQKSSNRGPKRAPKVNTDLKAYLREIEEQGENRG